MCNTHKLFPAGGRKDSGTYRVGIPIKKKKNPDESG